MDDVLERIILGRLDADDKLAERTRALVIGACHDAEALDATLEGTAPQPSKKAGAKAPSARNPAYIQSIEVQGFRGVGPPAALPITTGPGLTLVVGRNGSGKSSFAEALELLLTGDNSRWSTRSAIWKEGWRNLHQSEARIDAEFVVEGTKGTTVVSREWKPDAKLEEAETVVSVQGSKTSDLETMGWAGAVEMYRPFLSYSELGSMLDAGPSALYDALSAILGLEDLIEAEARLKDASKQRKRLSDEAKLALPPILERLATVEDERASISIEALSAKTWDLDAVEKAVIGTEEADREESQLAVLRQLVVLEAPDADEVRTAADGLRAAASALREMGGTEAAKARETAELLGAALTFHERHGDQDCPVCGQGSLDADWRAATGEEIGRLRQLAEQVDLAHRLMEESVKSARAHLLPVPAVLSSASGIGLEVEGLLGAWKAWSAGASIEESEALAEHLLASLPPVAEGVEKLKARASRELQRREDVWRPIATDLAGWLDTAKRARSGEEVLKDLSAAEKWIRAASNDIRNERFAPIADQAQGVWDMLRMQSSVLLKKIVLTGAGSARKVVLEVSVDGMEGAALGVMSQGELNSLALSLFMPRATLPESPFRFVVIDDPVQSMDPARVDGLARMLEKAAQTRQVIVFTHDERLARSCRLLGIDAKIVEVTRRPDSVVELRPGQDPVSRYGNDAWAVANSEDLDPAVRARIVGVFCRLAMEAACTEAVTRRRLAKGEEYESIEALLDSAKGLAQLMALALFDDMARTKDLTAALDRGIGTWAVAAYRRIQEAAHKPVGQEDVLTLVRESEKLARGLVQLP
jgi:energy-coupling factor transporter ATP-binding protein EcfA2